MTPVLRLTQQSHTHSIKTGVLPGADGTTAIMILAPDPAHYEVG